MIMAGTSIRISHIFREKNAAADMLARLASEGCTASWNAYADLPWRLWGLLKIDKMGLPYIRYG